MIFSDRFDVWCIDIKNKFLKIIKYYYDVFSSKKYFES